MCGFDPLRRHHRNQEVGGFVTGTKVCPELTYLASLSDTANIASPQKYGLGTQCVSQNIQNSARLRFSISWFNEVFQHDENQNHAVGVTAAISLQIGPNLFSIILIYFVRNHPQKSPTGRATVAN